MLRRLVLYIALPVAVAGVATILFLRRIDAPSGDFHRARSATHPTAGGRLDPFTARLVDSLLAQTRTVTRYKDEYYSGGDPPENTGVCTDVVIRAFRNAGVDLKTEVAADVRADPSLYFIIRPDPNIDHRRCRNLIVFFRRHARELPGSDWKPGDVVFWSTHNDGRVDHVGMIACGKDAIGNPTVIHHWPGLPVSETDGLHSFQIVGHFRWQTG